MYYEEVKKFLEESLDDIIDIVLNQEQEARLVGYLERVIAINEQFGEQVGSYLRNLVNNLKAREHTNDGSNEV
jgi:hypothetical protein